MELTVATIFVAFAGVFLISFMRGAFGGGFAIIGIPLLSTVMDPVAAGGLLAPLFIAMDLYALRYWKPSTWSKPELVLLVPGLVIGIGVGYLVFSILDHRAIAILMAAITLAFVGLWLIRGAEVTRRPRSTPKAIAAGFTSGGDNDGGAFGRPPACHVPAAARPQQGNLRGNHEPVLYRRQRDQADAVVVPGAADGQDLGINGDLPTRYSGWRVVGLAASWCARPAPSLSRLLPVAGRDGVEAVVGRRFRLPRVNLVRQFGAIFGRLHVASMVVLAAEELIRGDIVQMKASNVRLTGRQARDSNTANASRSRACRKLPRQLLTEFS